MSITNTSKPTSSLTNGTKVVSYETWASMTTTWAAEVRTWKALGQFITNLGRVQLGDLWSASAYPWQMDLPWIYGGQAMTNIAKP